MLEFEHALSGKEEGTSYGWTYDIGGEMTRSVESEVEVTVFNVVIDKTTNAYGKHVSMSASIGHNLAWEKDGSSGVSYALGDANVYDKFVIRILDDIRFGTPVFEVHGGYSMCPGEPGTIWRDSGLMFQIIDWPGIDNTKLVEGEDAIFEARISHEVDVQIGGPRSCGLRPGRPQCGL